MHIISRQAFKEAAEKHPNQRQALLDLYKVLNKASVYLHLTK